jgi:hypothetical protein
VNSREAVCRVLDGLAAASIPHMVTGGLVANAYGIARSTHDADIVVQVDEGSFGKFVSSLPAELRLDPQISFETVTGSLRHLVEVRGIAFRIEFFFE